MRLVTFGIGYVGLVTGTGLAELGHDVLCVDIDPERIRQLNDGVIPIYEPGLARPRPPQRARGPAPLLHGRRRRYDEADAYFIAVGTPPGPDGAADVSAVLAVAERIAATAKKPALVVVKSTVPVGTCDAVQARVDAHAAERDARGRVEPGVSQGGHRGPGLLPARSHRPRRAQRARPRAAPRRSTRPLQLSGERVVVTDPRSSELTKYAANTMLAMRVSFMNELSRLCHATGADMHAVRLGVGSDTRIGKRFLYAGPGYGGSCFPKDVQALLHLGRAHGVPMRLAEATHLANEEQAHFLAQLVEKRRGHARRARPSRSGASPSSRRRTTSASRPPIKLADGAARQGRERRRPRPGGRRATSPRRWPRTATASRSSTATTTRSTARTRSSCSPSGAATARRTSPRSASACATPTAARRPSSSTRATCGARRTSIARGPALPGHRRAVARGPPTAPTTAPR